jgi:hypothetical protein
LPPNLLQEEIANTDIIVKRIAFPDLTRIDLFESGKCNYFFSLASATVVYVM